MYYHSRAKHLASWIRWPHFFPNSQIIQISCTCLWEMLLGSEKIMTLFVWASHSQTGVQTVIFLCKVAQAAHDYFTLVPICWFRGLGCTRAGVLWWTCTVYFIELEWSINRPIKIRPDLLNNILQHSSNKWKLMEIISVNLISRDSNSNCQNKCWKMGMNVSHEVKECLSYKYTKVNASEKMTAVQGVCFDPILNIWSVAVTQNNTWQRGNYNF